jgi:hypothetical protein
LGLSALTSAARWGIRTPYTRCLVRFLPLVVLFPLGCVEYDLQRFDGTDIFYQKPADLVDILLVVDNSCSMAPYQGKLASNFQAFIQFFVDVDVDYHIGVTTTTVTEPWVGGNCTQQQINKIPAPGHLVFDRVINSETNNAEQLFSQMVNVGTCGSGSEMGLEAAALALGAQTNADFLRAEAELSIIFVSDEEDGSPSPVNDYLNAFRAAKPDGGRESMDVSALVVTDLSSCDAQQQQAGATEGNRYLDVAEQGKGVIGNICADDFASIVTDLSLNSSRLSDTFYLSSRPDLTTLEVEVNAEPYPCEDDSWTYLLETQEDGSELPVIVFEREYLPPPSAQVAIRYFDGEGDPNDFCGGAE